MYRNYMIIVIRNIRRQPLLSGINIIGLSTAIGCCLLVYAFLDMVYYRDTFHEHANRIFMVEYTIDREGRTQTWGYAPPALGPALKTDFPQVVDAVRIIEGRTTVRFEDRVFDERILYVDPGFFDTFTFPLKYGNPDALSDRAGVVLSEETAVKYFGDEDPIGQLMTFTVNDKITQPGVVKAVAGKQPQDASFRFDMLLPYDRQADFGLENRDGWDELMGGTFIRVNTPQDIEVLRDEMDRYISLQNAANPDWSVTAFLFDNILNLSENRHLIRGGIIKGGADPATRGILLWLAICVMALACFNYINVAIASASKRLKEIGIRKAVGSHRSQVIIQFLMENTILCAMALICGLWIGKYIFVPTFALLFGGVILEVDLLANTRIWLFMLGMLIITTVTSGIYPAYYISAYQPVAIFHGNQNRGGKNLFTRILLSVQFVLSFVLISLSAGLYHNVRYFEARDWGYSQENLITVPFDDERQFTLFSAATARHADIEMTAGSRHIIGRARGSSVVEINGTEQETIRFDVGMLYPEVLQLQPVIGRLFDPEQVTDRDQSVLINETFASRLGLEEPVGQQIIMEGKTYSIIGMLADFHYTGFHRMIEPTIVRVADDDAMRYLSIRVRPGTAETVMAHLSTSWKGLFPDRPYNGYFHEEVFTFFFQEQAGITSLFSGTATMALVISCMGFMGLVSLSLGKRMREFSIRKVLGASTGDVTRLITRELMIVILTAIVFAIPIGYYVLNMLFVSVYPYHTAIGPIPFLTAAVILTAVTFLTIGSRIYRAAHANPVESLHYE